MTASWAIRVEAKKSAFDSFIKTSEQFKTIENSEPAKVKEFILSLLEPDIDARIFEIVSYSILKNEYKEQNDVQFYIGLKWMTT